MDKKVSSRIKWFRKVGLTTCLTMGSPPKFSSGISVHASVFAMCDDILVLKARDCPFHIQVPWVRTPSLACRVLYTGYSWLFFSSLFFGSLGWSWHLWPQAGEQNSQTLPGKWDQLRSYLEGWGGEDLRFSQSMHWAEFFTTKQNGKREI